MDKRITAEEINQKLPSEGYLRLWQIIGGKGYPPLIPISKSVNQHAIMPPYQQRKMIP